MAFYIVICTFEISLFKHYSLKFDRIFQMHLGVFSTITSWEMHQKKALLKKICMSNGPNTHNESIISFYK